MGYTTIPQAVRDRLAERGIDPDLSTAGLLLAIRSGEASPRLLRNLIPDAKLRWQGGIPMAVTLTAEESAQHRRAA